MQDACICKDVAVEQPVIQVFVHCTLHSEADYARPLASVAFGGALSAVQRRLASEGPEWQTLLFLPKFATNWRRSADKPASVTQAQNFCERMHTCE